MNNLLNRIAASVPLLLIASVVVVSLLAWSSDRLRRAMTLIPYRVRKDGQVYRLLTAGWLHVDATHLLFNLLTLYFFASEVLKLLGDVRFLVLYVSAVIVGYIPTTLRHMNNPRYSSVGASGAVSAVLFSAVLLQPGLQLSLMFLPIRVPGLVYGAIYLAYSAWQSYRASDGINHDAHFSGAIYGAALTYLFEPARVERTVRGFL